MKKILLSAVLLLWLAPSAYAAYTCPTFQVPGVDPTSFVANVYKVYISANGDCSSPTVLYDASADDTNPTKSEGYKSIDLVANATLGSGSIAAGTYKCVIFKTSSIDTVVPATSDGRNCNAGQSYTFTTCRTTVPTWDPENKELVSCSGAIDITDIQWTYFSTWSVNKTSSGDCADCTGSIPPTTSGDTKYGFILNNGTDIDLSSNIIGLFTFGVLGHVCSDNGTDGSHPRCEVEPAEVAFNITK